MSKKRDYRERLARFQQAMIEFCQSKPSGLEFIFEQLSDESLLHSYDEIVDWYEWHVVNDKTTVIQIPLSECRDWVLCRTSGSLVHSSGDFFRVDGVRTQSAPTREVSSGWDQPFLTQVGFDGGIIGLLRKRFGGVPHYLCECKMEPGNYRKIQVTTTLQATFSNLRRSHGGHKTPYAEYFELPEENDCVVVTDQWASEDGGRLFNKRNRTMIVEHAEGIDLPLLASRYRWCSLYQLKRLTAEHNALVSPHIRSVLGFVGA